jgi:hypothetical protein
MKVLRTLAAKYTCVAPCTVRIGGIRLSDNPRPKPIGSCFSRDTQISQRTKRDVDVDSFGSVVMQPHWSLDYLVVTILTTLLLLLDIYIGIADANAPQIPK